MQLKLRVAPLLIVLLSGAVICLLCIPLQVLAWELRPYLSLRFDWDPYRRQPIFTQWFIELFSYRPNGHLASICIWFWWPMVMLYGLCSIKCQTDDDFSRQFYPWYLVCCVLFCLFLSAIAFCCALPFLIMMVDLKDPPSWMNVVGYVSYALPISVLAVFAVTWLHSRLSVSHCKTNNPKDRGGGTAAS